MDASMIRSKRRGYLFLSTLILLFLGLIYAFSMFARPMTQDFSFEGNVGLTFNIMMIMFCVGSVIGSVLDKKLGIRPSLVIAAVLFGVGFVGTGIVGGMTGEVWSLYLFYGVIGGLGVGVGYNTIIATTNVWFPDKVGFSSGVLMMGFGMSSLIFGNVALQLRPLFGGMGVVLVVLGVLVAVLTFVLAAILKRPPSNIVEVMTPAKAQKADAGRVEEAESIFKTPVFYLYWIWAIIVIAIGLATIGNCAADAMRIGAEEGFASLLVGLVSTFNGLSRIIVGLLFDKTNIKVTMLVDGLVGTCAALLVVGAFATSSLALYVPGALLCGFAYGGVPVIASAFSRQRYGAKTYPFNLSVANFAIALGSVLNVAIAAFVGQDARMTIFVIMLSLSLAALADVFFFSKVWDKDMKKKQGNETAPAIR